MNDVPVGIIPAGTRLAFDGGLRQVSISHLLADPATRLLDAASAPPPVAWPGASGSPAGARQGE